MAITPHMAMEHYLLACGLRRFTRRWKKIHDKHFKAFMHGVDLKSFIHVNCCKSSQIKISNYRIKSNLVMHQMCPKYSLLSPLQIHRTSASSLKRNNFPREMKAERAFRRSLILCFSFGKSHSTIAPSCPPDLLPPITVISVGSRHRTRGRRCTATTEAMHYV